MFINGGVTQVFYDGGRNPLFIRPYTTIPENVARSLSGFTGEAFDRMPADAIFKTFNPVLLHRSFALGDVLMLLPIIRAAREKYDANVFGSSSGEYQKMFGELGRTEKDSTRILLDGCLELDHTGGRESRMHRIDIYLETIGMSPNTEVEWILPLELDQRIAKASEKLKLKSGKFIALQAGGSTNLKTVPAETTVALAKLFLSRGYGVYIFDNRKFHMMTPPGVINVAGHTDTFEAWAIIRHCELLVCCDSSPLWMGHFEKKPTICLLGPTRIEERLTRHPLFGTGKVRGVELNKIYGCEACFEKMEKCGGNAACMKQPTAIVMKAVNTILEEIENS
jgi:hypothetical protein